MFVCDFPAGDDAAMTTDSPGAVNPVASKPSAIEAIISSVSSGTRAGSARTPHRRDNALRGGLGEQRVDRHARPLGRQQRSGSPGPRVTRDRDDRRVGLFRDLGGRVRDFSQ